MVSATISVQLIRATDAKEVGQRMPFEETYRHPDQIKYVLKSVRFADQREKYASVGSL